MTTPTDTPGLEECTPWKVESYALHEEYTHGRAPTPGKPPPVSVGLWEKGPNAVVLERALFLNGYTNLLLPPDGDPEIRAPRADGGKTWRDVPHVELVDIHIMLPNGDLAAKPGSWPARAHRIDVETTWNVNGATSRRSLPTDLAFGRTDVSDPQLAYPYLTKNSEIPSKTLETLILAAYSGADLYEPEPDELDQHRAAAHAAAEIAMHGMEGWLTAVGQLVEDRVLSCLQAETRPPPGESESCCTTSRHRRSRPRAAAGAIPSASRWRPTQDKRASAPIVFCTSTVRSTDTAESCSASR